jgi:hypothetical protein
MQKKRGVNTVPEQTILELTQENIDFLKRYSELIVQHRLTQAALEQAMQQYLMNNLGIDTSVGDWELDLQRGLIRVKPEDNDGLDKELL